MSRENILLEAESFSTVKESQVSEETKEKSNTENGVYVKGMALPFGKTSRNGVQYTKESVEKAHEDLQGRTMLFNHKQDWVTGHILNTEITDSGMYFEGDINPNAEMPNGVPVAQAIDRGDINSVSIQAFIEQLGEPADEEAIIDDMETEKVAVKDFLEISAVSIPGFPQAEAMPEHLQQQGVVPVTEAVGGNDLGKTEESKDDRKGEPFAGYDDFEACVADNQDKDDPEAYCGEIKDKAEETDTSKEQTYDDYPKAAQENARMALEAKEDTGDPNDCGTQVGWERANQLDNGESLSEDTIGRMSAFSRHEDNKDQGEEGRADCGWMMWNAWGGDEGIEWAENKMDEIDEENLSDEVRELVQESRQKEQYEFAPVPSHVLYDNEEDAKQRAENLGLQEIHEHEMSGQIYYMAGDNHEEWLEAVNRSNPTDNNDESNDKEDEDAMTNEEEQEGKDSAESEEVKSEANMNEVINSVMDTIDGHSEQMKQDVREVVEDMTDMDEKSDDPMEDDEEDDEEEQTDPEQEEQEQESIEDIDRDELEEKFESQEEKIDELENRLEKILDNDEGTSKQESPSSEEGKSSVSGRPSFKGLTD